MKTLRLSATLLKKAPTWCLAMSLLLLPASLFLPSAQVQAAGSALHTWTMTKSEVSMNQIGRNLQLVKLQVVPTLPPVDTSTPTPTSTATTIPTATATTTATPTPPVLGPTHYSLFLPIVDR